MKVFDPMVIDLITLDVTCLCYSLLAEVDLCCLGKRAGGSAEGL